MATFYTRLSYMSLGLAAFFGLPWNAQMSRDEARERVRQYIIDNNLIAEFDPNEVKVDKALRLFVKECHIKNQQVSLGLLLEFIVSAQFGGWETDQLTLLLFCLHHYELSHLI